MDELVKFLRERLDEDEAAARAATPGPWEQSGIGEYGWGVSFGRPGAGVEADDSDQGRADAEHIARHDPARVLAEVETKRLALDHFEELQRLARGGVAIYRTAAGAVGVQVQIMALAYRDHPGYQGAWRPEHLD